MKLKFRADAQDLMIFGIFAVFLLYVVALGVVNLPSLATTGSFAGLNPLPAFGPDKITATIVFYLVALGGLFLSVSSYFFDREEGFGFSTSKKDKGYSRWAKEKEIKKVLKRVYPVDDHCDCAGIPIISKNGELWVDNGESHTLVIGATGSGKTVNTILPTIKVLAKKGESIICTDPKGELYEKTGALLKEKGYNIILLNFRNPQKGNAWNPLTLPYRLYKNGNQDKSIELLDDLALNILYEENSGNADPFWEKTSADYFSGLALGLFEDAKEEQININSISLTTTVGEEKIGGSTYVKAYFDLKDPNGAAYINASGTIMAPNETKGSIISVFKQKIKLFSSRENLSEMLSYSDFSLENIGKEKTAIFIIIHDEKKTYHSLATIFVKQCYETLIDVAQQNGGKLPIRTNFLLDEFANMPPLKDVTTMITAARSRQVRFIMIIQNFAQLNQVYGKENAETIKGNCGNIIYLISSELAALEEISKLCGEVKSKKDDKTASTPLVTVSDLQRMKQFEQIVLIQRMQPFKTAFTPDFRIDWGKKYGLLDYPQREKKPLQIFDVRDYVKEKRSEKIKEMMNEGGVPQGGPSSSMMAGGAFGPMPNSGMGVQTRPTTAYPTQVPFNSNNSTSNSNNGDLNIDDLLKKIDAKISEIEEEEKKANQPATPATNVASKPLPRQEIFSPIGINNPTTPKNVNPSNDLKLSTDELENKVNRVIEQDRIEQEKAVSSAKDKPKEVPTISLEDSTNDENKFFDDFFED